MGKRYSWLCVLLCSVSLCAEIIDRVAVTVDKIVITESDILDQIRIAALLNGTPPDTSPTARKKAASRLVEQILIRREMEITRYPAPAASEVKPVLEKLKKDHFNGEGSYRKALERYGVSESDLRENLLLQLTVLRFIQYRFRPGIAIDDKAIRSYYEQEFLPAWKRRSSEAPPSLEDSRDKIEEILIARRVDKALDRWLKQAATRARIQYHKEAFQ